MEVAIPYITPTEAHVNALLIQPTGWCARSCTGCYTKHFENQDKFSAYPSLWINIFRAAGQGDEGFNKLSTNQITFALDKLSIDSYKYQIMLDLAYGYFFYASKDRTTQTEFHATVHTIDDLLGYTSGLKTNKFNLEMLSISHLTEASIYNLKTLDILSSKTKINWNLTVDPTINLQKIKDSFIGVASAVDSIYLVLHKPCTGNYYPAESIAAYKDFQAFISRQYPEIQRKVIFDTCITDSEKFLSTGFGCSAGVNKFHIWPDGSVTGCPYNQRRLTPGASTVEEVIKNIYQVNQIYREFDSCKIPNHLDNNNPWVVQRHKPYLQILD